MLVKRLYYVRDFHCIDQVYCFIFSIITLFISNEYSYLLPYIKVLQHMKVNFRIVLICSLTYYRNICFVTHIKTALNKHETLLNKQYQ